MVVTAIILSAGKSSRMGQIKALLPYEGKTFIENIIESARNSGINEILVVLGFNKEKILPLTLTLSRDGRGQNDMGVKPVINPHPEEGQFSSLKTGLLHLCPETDAALVHLVDVPAVKSETFRAVIEAYRGNPEKIIIPYYNGRHGHPVIFPRKFFKELLNYPADKNARDFIREQATDDILNLEVDDPGILKDFDTREDLGGM